MCYLPGIDCGACGNPNCQSLAEDIVRHEAQFSDCIFMQRNMEKMSHYITQQVAGIATFDYRIQILFSAKNGKIQFFYKGKDEDIPLLGTSLSAFVISGKVYQLLQNG